MAENETSSDHSSRRGLSRTAITWMAVLSFAAGAAFGHFRIADASRAQAFLDGEAFGTYRTACQTEFALLWLYESEQLRPEDAGLAALILADIGIEIDGKISPTSMEMTQVFGESAERVAAEIYLVMGQQFAFAPDILLDEHPIGMYGRDLRPDIKSVARIWFGRSLYVDKPAEWRSSLVEACARLVLGA